MNKTAFVTLAFATAVIVTGPAFADKFKAALDGKSEVPPTTSTGTGTADIDYDPATKKLSWKLTYTGLTGAAKAAHFTVWNCIDTFLSKNPCIGTNLYRETVGDAVPFVGDIAGNSTP